ncbi:AAA family ATPase [Halobium salinum]|uniref:AAA family ATPase n=1 Tax=Halobium salinum TaxID=1364940 RepID=A0ABD5PFL8_9EURY|nr:ATP-binding protein [Halobium salinum]
MPDSSSSNEPIQRPVVEVIAEYINNGVGHIHIAGEPGIGKTTTLHQIAAAVDDGYNVDIRNIRPNHELTDLFREINHALFDRLPDDLTEEGRQLTGISVGPVGGVSWDSDAADVKRPQSGHRDILRRLAAAFPDDQRLLICVDDVHELGDDDRAIRGAMEEAADALPPNVLLVTAGRLTYQSLDTSVCLDTFTEEQTAQLLRNAFEDITDVQIHDIHNQVDGHPLYLGLLIDSNDDSTSLNLPDNDVFREIEQRYLQSLSPDERRLLRATAPLSELNEAICTYVLPEGFDLDRIDVADILDSLSNRIIVQTIGRTHNGLRIFKVHDVFRDFLKSRWDHTEETEQKAFQYYAETVIEQAGHDLSLEREVKYITLCLEFLSTPVIQAKAEVLSHLIEQILTEEELSFYPTSLLLTDIKTRDTTELPDKVIKTVVANINVRQKIAKDFYDDQLHLSWAKHQFNQGSFEDPSGNLLSYLNRISDTYPSFVSEVIVETTTENPRTHRYLISLGTELPAEDAIAVAEQAIEWIQDTTEYHELARPGLELVTYLCEQNAFDTALELLNTILTPRQGNSEGQLEGAQGMTRYNLIQTLDETFDILLTERGTAFIDLLKTNLEAALRIEEESQVDHEVIENHFAVTDLNYADENRGNLQQLLLEYFTRASTKWLSDDPDGTERRELIEELLDGPIVFRRVGFVLLASHPESFRDTVKITLQEVDNYRSLPAGYEFYQLLKSGFTQLDTAAQERICEIISGGPYTAYEEWAEQLAEEQEEPASYFEQRIEETWRRDRFYLIREELPAPYADVLPGLIEKHGEPDRLPTESPISRTTGGFVNQRGPEQIEEYQNWPAEEVLKSAVEWEPPEATGWDTNEHGRFEERNHLGFSRQLSELIREHPTRYAHEISILEDANPRYADAAFGAFRNLLDDGQTFPWNSIVALATAITEDPTEWTSSCRTNLAMLLNKGIAADETPFPRDNADEVRAILLVLLGDPDPDPERDQPEEGVMGHGDPVQVAINSVRPMALNAFITFLWWTTQQGGNLDPTLLDAVEKRMTDDPALAVRTVIGRRFGTLWELDSDRIERCLEDVFPRGEMTVEQRRFTAAWNSFVRHNVMWGYDALRPYYRHAIQLLDTSDDDIYEINTRSTATHVLSDYLFGDASIADDNSLIRRYYDAASPEEATELAISLADSFDNPEVEDRWDAIRNLWDWRLDQIENAGTTPEQKYADELRQFLDCVHESSTIDLTLEKGRIQRSLPIVILSDLNWRRIEDWLAEQSDSYSATSVDLYRTMVESVNDEKWSSLARTSQDSNRKRIYEKAAEEGEESIQSALWIANQFAAEGYETDREFLDDHL